MNCNTVRSLLLDFLFDLLDQNEKQPFEAHLLGCESCQKELDWARGRQKLLKSATLESFPEVHFRAEDLLSRQTEPSSSQSLGKARSISQWGFVAAAVALLLVFPIWGLLLNQERDSLISLAHNQESGLAGKTLVSLSELEKTVTDAVALAQNNPNEMASGHKALSVPNLEKSASELKTMILVPDAPLKPGSIFQAKSVTLESGSLKLAQEKLEIRFTLKGPGFEQSQSMDGMGSNSRNQPAKFRDGRDVSGIGLVLFELPREISGGPWELVVSESKGRFPTVRKNLPIEGIRPAITQTVRWDKEQYKSGEKARLTVRLTQGDGLSLAGAKINMTLILGGTPWNPEGKSSRKGGLERISDENGQCTLEFEIPARPNSGQNEVLIQSRSGEAFVSEKYPLPFWR